MPSPADLFISLLISALGSAYLLYGRRQSNGAALISGMALLVLPTVIPGLMARLLLTLTLMAIPWLSSRL